MKIDRKIPFIILICYTVLLSYWMLFAFGRGTHLQYMYNLRPLLTIRGFIKNSGFRSSISMVNLVGNIVVFVPFGILIPIVFTQKYLKMLGIFLSGLFILEILQLLTRRGSFDIDDFILNSLGASLGFLIYKLLKKIHVIK